MKMIKTIPVMVVILLASLAMSGQSSADFDKSVDFTKYKTYTFQGWEKNSDKQLNELDKKRVEDSFVAELAKRGMSASSSNADIGITLFLTIANKTSTTAYTTFNGGMGYGMGGYRWGYGAGMGMGMGSATTSYNEDDYQEGTAIIDFYDEETKKLVWQGTMKSVVAAPHKREKSIPKNVAKVMKRYPVKPMKKKK
jgi:hypothetical protein